VLARTSVKTNPRQLSALYLLAAQELEVLCCDSSAPSHAQLSGFVLTIHAMSFCKSAMQAMQGNEAMTWQAVTWQMLKGPKRHLRTKGTDLHMAAWLLGSMLNLT